MSAGGSGGALAVIVPMFLPEPGNNGDAYATALGELLGEVFRRTSARSRDVVMCAWGACRRSARR